MIVFLPMKISMYDVTAQDSASLTITTIKQLLCILTNVMNAAEHIAFNYRCCGIGYIIYTIVATFLICSVSLNCSYKLG